MGLNLSRVTVRRHGDVLVAGQAWTGDYDFATVRFFGSTGSAPVTVHGAEKGTSLIMGNWGGIMSDAPMPLRFSVF